MLRSECVQMLRKIFVKETIKTMDKKPLGRLGKSSAVTRQNIWTVLCCICEYDWACLEATVSDFDQYDTVQTRGRKVFLHEYSGRDSRLL